jgi:hypothetical protein
VDLVVGLARVLEDPLVAGAPVAGRGARVVQNWFPPALSWALHNADARPPPQPAAMTKTSTSAMSTAHLARESLAGGCAFHQDRHQTR